MKTYLLKEKLGAIQNGIHHLMEDRDGAKDLFERCEIYIRLQEASKTHAHIASTTTIGALLEQAGKLQEITAIEREHNLPSTQALDHPSLTAAINRIIKKRNIRYIALISLFLAELCVALFLVFMPNRTPRDIGIGLVIGAVVDALCRVKMIADALAESTPAGELLSRINPKENFDKLNLEENCYPCHVNYSFCFSGWHYCYRGPDHRLIPIIAMSCFIISLKF